MDDDLLAEVGGLGEKSGVEVDPAGGGAASPLAGHGANMDLLGLDLIRLAQASTSERRISLGIISSKGCQPARSALRSRRRPPDHAHDALGDVRHLLHPGVDQGFVEGRRTSCSWWVLVCQWGYCSRAEEAVLATSRALGTSALFRYQ